MFKYYIIIPIILIVYCGIAGPIVWVGNQLNWSENSGVGGVVIVLLYPHIVLAENWNEYSRYLLLWKQ